MSAPPLPTLLAPVTLVLGGARSGKSRHAEALVESQPGPCIYLATAQAGDAEMAARIAAHRARRGGRWTTVEEPLDLAAALDQACGPDRAVLVDCLTLWLSNLLGAGRPVAAECDGLLAALPERGIALCPSADRGTSALALRPPDVITFRFGERSSVNHKREAMAIGVPAEVVRIESLAHDVDSPEDLRRLLARPGETATHRLLAELGVEERLE